MKKMAAVPEILHEEQRPDTGPRKQHEQDSIAVGHQPFQRGAARENEGHLDEFGRLDGDEAEVNPVFRPAPRFPDEQVEHEEPHRQRPDDIPQLHGQLHVPQDEAQHAEHGQSQQHRGKLLVKGRRHRARRHKQPDGHQEKGQQLHAHPLKPGRDAAVNPLHEQQPGKAHRQRQRQLIGVMQQQGQSSQQLE